PVRFAEFLTSFEEVTRPGRAALHAPGPPTPTVALLPGRNARRVPGPRGGRLPLLHGERPRSLGVRAHRTAPHPPGAVHRRPRRRHDRCPAGERPTTKASWWWWRTTASRSPRTSRSARPTR